MRKTQVLLSFPFSYLVNTVNAKTAEMTFMQILFANVLSGIIYCTICFFDSAHMCLQTTKLVSKDKHTNIRVNTHTHMYIYIYIHIYTQ